MDASKNMQKVICGNFIVFKKNESWLRQIEWKYDYNCFNTKEKQQGGRTGKSQAKTGIDVPPANLWCTGQTSCLHCTDSTNYWYVTLVKFWSRIFHFSHMSISTIKHNIVAASSSCVHPTANLHKVKSLENFLVVNVIFFSKLCSIQSTFL